MAFGEQEQWQTEDSCARIQGTLGTDARSYRNGLLAGKQLWPDFEFIDIHSHNEGRLLGYYLGLPFDWNVLDPKLMR